MMKFYGIVFILCIGITLLQADESWLTDYDQAVKKAKEVGKPILVDFTGSDWCGWCIKLKKEVFNTPEFAEWAKEKVVLLELDFPKKKSQSAEEKAKNAKLAKQYKIEGYPTILFLDASGEEVRELGRSGYLKGGPKVWTENANQFLSASEDLWLISYEEAVTQAKAVLEEKEEPTTSKPTSKPTKPVKKETKPRLILTDFTGSDWCGWCIKLKNEVFNTAEFKAWAKENVILLEIDFPQGKPQSEETKKQNAELQAKYNIEGYPTILFLTVDGEKVAEMGYMKGGPKAWIAEAQKVVDGYNQKK